MVPVPSVHRPVSLFDRTAGVDPFVCLENAEVGQKDENDLLRTPSPPVFFCHVSSA